MQSATYMAGRVNQAAPAHSIAARSSIDGCALVLTSFSPHSSSPLRINTLASLTEEAQTASGVLSPPNAYYLVLIFDLAFCTSLRGLFLHVVLCSR